MFSCHNLAFDFPLKRMYIYFYIKYSGNRLSLWSYIKKKWIKKSIELMIYCYLVNVYEHLHMRKNINMFAVYLASPL